MTDGFPTMDEDVSAYLVDADGDGNDPGSCTSLGAPFDDSYQCSDHMDDVAHYLFNNDLRADLPDTQNVITYTIGYGVDYGLLAETAMNGDGRYFHAENAGELVYAFRAIMQDIIMRLSSGSAVAVVSTERGDNDRMYRGKFMPGSWEGFLECYTLPFEDGEPPVWEAGNILADRSANSRSIFTALGSSVYNFVPGSAHNLWQAMETPDVETAADIITWIRGDFVAEYRNRADWKLGDIVSSTPVIVGRPRSFSTDEAYQEYAALYADRLKTVYVGANDGMVHAFDAENGDELWAFVPQFALPKLSAIADSFYCHTYTCDQSISIADVKIGGVWRTVLATGGREGGSGYFALDVSEPTAPALMWQADLPNGKAFASEVEFARIGGVPVALIGSGLDEEFIESYLYAYNVETGQLIGSRLLSSSNQDRNKTTRPRAVDLDFDGETDLVYCADLLGNLWRADVGNDPDPSSWNLTTLFSCDQPITATPNPAFGEGNKVLVYFGTGAFLKEEDFDTTDQQSFYCVYDSHDGSTHTRSNLVDQTSSINDIGTADGWYVDLWHHDGERVTEQAVVVAQTVYFTAYAPRTAVCEAGGHSWLYTMAYDDGSAVINEEGEEVPRDEDLGDGVASRPVVDIVNETAVIQSSDATITVVDIAIDIFHLTVKSWQENYDFVQEPPQVQ